MIILLLESHLIITIIYRYLIMKSYKVPSEYVHPQIPTGFLTPTHAHGHNTFMLLLDDLTAMQPAVIKRLCLWLGVCSKTMNRYIADTSPVPHAVCYAMFFESQWGRDSINCKAVNDRQMLTTEISLLSASCRNLKAENILLAAQVSALSVAANAPVFAHGERITNVGKDIHARSVVRPAEAPPHPVFEFKIQGSRHRR